MKTDLSFEIEEKELNTIFSFYQITVYFLIPILFFKSKGFTFHISLFKTEKTSNRV